MSSIPLSTFDQAYENHTAPWVIGEPQPAFVALDQHGWISGNVLDVGCGTGENAIHLAERGHDVLGLDFSQLAVDAARENARHSGVNARFEVADALQLRAEPRFDTIVDSALFHLLGQDDRVRYAERLHGVCRPGAVVHVLGLSDVDPGFGPVMNEDDIPAAFSEGWTVEDVRRSRYRGVVDAEQSARLIMPAGQPADMLAILARIRRQ